MTEEKGLQDICRAMDSHSGVAELIELGCAALWSLSMEGICGLIFMSLVLLSQRGAYL